MVFESETISEKVSLDDSQSFKTPLLNFFKNPEYIQFLINFLLFSEEHFFCFEV